MAAAASINMFLLDGSAEGAIKCSTRGQDTIVYKIPRADINTYVGRDDLKKAGIYFLVGEIDKKPAIYVGQGNARKNGNGVLGRVIEHRKASESYWNVAFILISNSDWVSATELNYLEYQFCNMANNAGSYHVVNAWDPSLGKVSEETKVTMEPFIDYTKLVLKIQGYKPFEKDLLATCVTGSKDDVIEMFLVQQGKEGRSVDARCKYIDGKYVVLKGSKIASLPTNSCPKRVANKRAMVANCIDKNNILKKDIEFDSPSSAASFVILGTANGNILWKSKDGICLKDLQ